MHRLTCRPRGERGAVATIVALLMAGGVLFGMAAITVDVGQIYSERRELQNGADAGALAIAQDCAKGEPCDAGTGPGSMAGQYANQNAKKDDVADVVRVCGESPGLPSCPPPNGSFYDCPPSPPAGTKYVEVKTATEEVGGSTLLPPTFARLLLGNEGYDGINVYACAQASWDAPSSIEAFPVTISLCEWDNFTANGTDYAPPPPYDAGYPTSYEHAIYLHTTKGLSGCPAGPSGGDLPGGFGWLYSDDCKATVDENDWVSTDPGVSLPNDCKSVIDDKVGSVIYIPIYDDLTGTGSGIEYHVKGFAAFYLTGYNVPSASGNPQPSIATGTKLCTGDDKCIYGWFTEGLVPVADPGGSGPPMGATVVSLIG